ncbi:SAV_2336 N-terminal domain-related protein [Streptomyces sp. NPDC008092]|uniref:SAV_2336 N-terminal domain-related protein n=1 Tax=Streptomyces sp. NPDC008092 TaxID=3364808 RepID=UPI0036E76C36
MATAGPGGPRRPDDARPLAHLAAVLAAAAEADPAASAGEPPTPRELAELLWLARQLGPIRQEAPTGPDTPAGLPPDRATPGAAPPRTESPTHDVPATPQDTDRVPLHAPPPASTASDDRRSLLAPAPPMLHRPLALQRALRPLKRKVPSPRARVLDERATADRIARLGALPEVWLPVLRPAPERWLRLNLVHDTGPTMPVWHPLVRELHTALAQSGFFRTVTLHPATPDGRAPHVPAPADGRTVTLVLSDCMGPQWRPGRAGRLWYGTLRAWAGRMPLAVVQPLPEHLWATTALPATPGLLTAPAPAAPTGALAFTPYDPDAPPTPRGALPLPVLEPGPGWLANWASLVADPGGGRTPGAAAWLRPTPVPSPELVPDIASLSPQDLVLHFRATASPEAFRLAGHLALAVPSVPVMRLVQHTLLHDPRPQHLAEVVVSGMLTAVPGPAGTYDFRPGVRELLLRSLPRTARSRSRELLARVGGLIDERAGLAAGEFRAEAGHRGPSGTEFATVTPETVTRLGGTEDERHRLVGGRYRLVGPRGAGRRVREAVDVRTSRTVAVHLYPERAAPRERFLRVAQVLTEIDNRHVVRVLDYGMEGETPFLVTEFVDGVTLTELRRGSGPEVPFGLFARLASHVVSGLHALHARGLVRGQSGTDGLLLRPDGTVMISRFEVDEASAPGGTAADFDELSAFLRELARQVTAPAEYGRHRARIADGELTALEAAEALAASHDADSWSFHLLGPLRVGLLPAEPGITVPVSEAQALLCMLLLRDGRRVTYQELADGLWEEPPPSDEAVRRIDLLADQTLSRLGPGTLAALPDGYALHVPGAYIDARHCEELLTDWRTDDDAGARAERVRTALGLWYGDPLAGIPGPAADATRARLAELRMSLHVAAAELDLLLGDFERATTDLEALLREHPLRADLRRLHMTALRELGRITEAVESYESYAELRQRRREPVDPALDDLHRELRTGREALRATIVFRAEGGSSSQQARSQLGREATRLLALGGLEPHDYEVSARDNGQVFLTEPGTDVLPVLTALLREVPEALAEAAESGLIRVTFWHTPVVPAEVHDAPAMTGTNALVVVSPVLYAQYEAGPAASAESRFDPLPGGSPSAAPLAWYRQLPLLPPEPEPVHGELFTGPLVTHAPARDCLPEPGVKAIVLVPDHGRPVLMPPSGAPPAPSTRYYEVDLTDHRDGTSMSLPSSDGPPFTASVELTWNVVDPVAFVNGGFAYVTGVLFEHLSKEAARITRRHPPEDVIAAQHAVHAGLRDWPVPGLAVTCSVSLVRRDDTHARQGSPYLSQPSDAAHRALRELALAATVRIHRPSAEAGPDGPGTFLGSGFFIAPNWVLTCAHVACAGEGGEVAVVHRTAPGRAPSTVTGRVVVALPDSVKQPGTGSWPAPDLALVRLAEPVEHDCVYVSERAQPNYGEGRVHYAGWTVLGGQLNILDGALSVEGTIGSWSTGAQLRLGGNDLPPGVAGGPVLDPVRGEVVGILKSRATHGRGGTSTGIEQLRKLPVAAGDDLYQTVFHAHDRYHQDRQRDLTTARSTWTDVQSRLGVRPGGVLTAHERTDLLGRLAALPPPADGDQLLRILDALPDLFPSRLAPGPRGWRDGLGMLYEPIRAGDALGLVLDYAMRVLSADRSYPTPDVHQAENVLWEWIQRTAQFLDAPRRSQLAEQWAAHRRRRPSA